MKPPPFIADAEGFAAAQRRSILFRTLGWFMGAEGVELDQLIKKIFCVALPENTYDAPEPPLITLFGLPLLPLRLLCKSWRWRAETATDSQMEILTAGHFDRFFSVLYRTLPGTKRLSPRDDSPPPPGERSTLPTTAVAAPEDIARLCLLAPLWSILLLPSIPRRGLRLFKAFRQAVSIHAAASGHFARYPCRRFITPMDDLNHPARWLAFRRRGGRSWVVIQNGDRNLHPLFAFGRADVYCVFGTAYAEILSAIGTRAEAFPCVGAFYLNERHPLLQGLLAERPAPRWDLLFIDQGVFPHNGLCADSGRALLRLLAHVGEFARRHPERKVAVQLRPYAADDPRRSAVLDAVARTCPTTVEVLENDGRGSSYRNVLSARLAATFESSLGFEAMALGCKTLFVNYSKDPAETLCPDDRFQLTGSGDDFDAFEQRVLSLLEMQLDEIPAAARARHSAIDGRTMERIARILETDLPVSRSPGA